MLNAILKNKAGRINKENGSIRWRDVFRGSEDLTTATVVERISYLSGGTAWKLLSNAAGGSLPSFRLAELEEIDFWPVWGLGEKLQKVEPDVFLTLSLGDPPKRVEVILEAKSGTAAQREDQWISEIQAWKETYEISEENSPNVLILLALGGTGKRSEREDRARRFKGRAAVFLPERCELLVAMIDWEDLARACHFVAPPKIQEQRIITDIQKALELFGYFHLETPRQLEHLTLRKFSPRTLQNILKIEEQ